jgi:hypothetical protein
MGMITQDTYEIQGAISDILRCVPIALSTGGGCIYILIKDINKELARFISTGRTEAAVFHTLSLEEMKATAECCEQHGLTLTYRSHCMEYMHRKVTITYPQVSNHATGIKVSLIPWFLLPDRPYPIFTYAYAIWHYNSSGKKSQRLSAAATGKVFGVSSFNKSTVCRNIKALEGLFNSI